MNRLLQTVIELGQEFLEFLFPHNEYEKSLKKRYKENTLAIRKIYSHGWILSVFMYQDEIIKNAIHILKKRQSNIVLSVFCEVIFEKFSGEFDEILNKKLEIEFPGFIFIPIPISKRRKRERGFNQAEKIAQKIVKIGHKNNIPWKIETNVLFKGKETEKQATLENRQERLQNLRNCFYIKNEQRIVSKHIVLIDDVATTGATLREARKILFSHGAKKIFAVTVAH